MSWSWSRLRHVGHHCDSASPARTFLPHTATTMRQSWAFILPLLLLVGVQLVAAQFGFFENMFGQQQHHQQQQQRSGASQWAAYSDSGTTSLLPVSTQQHSDRFDSFIQFHARNICALLLWTALRSLQTAPVQIQRISSASSLTWRAMSTMRPLSAPEGATDVTGWNSSRKRA